MEAQTLNLSGSASNDNNLKIMTYAENNLNRQIC